MNSYRPEFRDRDSRSRLLGRVPFLAGCLFLSVALCAAGQDTREPAPATEPSERSTRGFASRDVRYHIQPGDVIEFEFRFTPELNQTVKVQPDGYIPLQDAEELSVGGLTVEEVKKRAIQTYAAQLKDPVLTLTLKEFAKPYFVVTGEVEKPGRYDLPYDATLTDAIAMGGGFNSRGSTNDVLLFRRVSRQWVEVKKINVKQILQRAHMREDILLRTGDSIYISRSKLGKIDRFMEVTRLGLYFNPLGGY